jgi:hypothetical protein
LREKILNENKDGVFRSLVRLPDRGVALTGTTRLKGRRVVWFLKLDTRGNIVCDKKYSISEFPSANSLTRADGNGFLITGAVRSKTFFMRLDGKGQKVRESIFKARMRLSKGLAVAELPNGNAIIAGEVDALRFKPTDAFVMLVSRNGENLSERIFEGYRESPGPLASGDGNSNDSANSVTVLPDGDIIICGRKSNRLWVARLNPKYDWHNRLYNLINGKVFLRKKNAATMK